MICPNCGVTVPEGREYCLTCGARIYRTPSSSDSFKADDYVSELIKKKKMDNVNKKIFVVIGIILIALGAFVFVYGFLFYSILDLWIYSLIAGILITVGIYFLQNGLKTEYL